MNWLNYLLQVNLYLVLFYGFYRLLLRSETFFNLNRGYLVASAALAFFIPLMQSEWVRSWFVTDQVSQTISTLYDPQLIYIQASATQATTMTMGEIMAFCYIIGIMLGIARFGGNLVFLGQLMKRKTQGEGSKRAFSFFNILFVSKELKSRSTIMKHEFVHIRQLHSADVLLFELIAIFNWFNPIVYLYKSSIKHIHEFIADEVASRHEASKAEYAMLLFQEQFGVQAIPLTNNFFNHSLLKLRIKMLHKSRSTQTALMKYGLIAPLFMLMIVVSSATLASKPIEQIEEIVKEVSAKDVPMINNNPVVEEVTENNPLDPNMDLSKALIISPALVDEVKTDNLFKKYFSQNLCYPASAQKSLIIGKIYIGFKTNSEGKILNIKSLNVAPPILLQEVIRVLNSIENVAELSINEPNNYVISVNFGLTIDKGNGTEEVLEHEPYLIFKDRKIISDFVVIGYAKSGIKKDTSEVFDAVDQQAEYQGGMNAFVNFLQENIKYPASAQIANVSGKVYTQFIVNTDGTISDVTILKSVGFGCDEEAMRVLKLAKWTPGKQSGKAVRSRFTVPIAFQIAKDDKIKINKKDNEEFPKLPAVMEFRGDKGEMVSTNMVINNKCKDCPPPLCIVDGVENQSNILKNLDPKNIESISILKDKKAVESYGKKGENGVIIITTKKK